MCPEKNPTNKREFQYHFISNINGGYYYFDKISKKIIKVLDSQLSNPKLDDSVTENSRIVYPYTISDVKKDHEANLKSLILVASEQCNLRCKYCVYGERYASFYRNHNKTVLEFKNAQKIIDFFIDRSSKTEKPIINFYGGEPLLNFDTICKIVGYVNKKTNNRIKFSISTNGTLLNKEVVNFCVSNSCELVVSLDGYDEINDKNRVFNNQEGSFNIISKNLEQIGLNYPEYIKKMVHILVHLEPPVDVQKTDLFLKEYSNIANISKVSFTIPEDDNSEKRGVFIDELKERYINQIVNGNFDQNTLSAHFFNPLIRDILGRYKRTIKDNNYFLNICKPCVSRLYSSTNGELFLCEKSDYNHSVGNIKNGFDYMKIEWLMNEYANNLECLNCWANSFCSHCFLDILSENNKIDKQKLYKKCHYKRGRYSIALKLYAEIVEKLTRENFKKFIDSFK